MARSKNNLTFSLPSDLIDRLEALAIEGESPALVAKRLLLEILSENQSINPFTFSGNEIQDLKDRVESLENFLCKFVNAQKQDWENQQKINQVIKDELGFRASIDDEPTQPVITSRPSLEELGLNLDLEPDEDDLITLAIKSVNTFLESCDDPCLAKFLVKHDPDGRGQAFVKLALDKIDKNKRKEIKPLIIKAFGGLDPCFVIYERLEQDDYYQFWTGRKWDRNWENAKKWEFEGDLAKPLKSLRIKLPHDPIKFDSLQKLLELQIIQLQEV